jgi:hypothetical protein
MDNINHVTYHKDGTVTYWSVFMNQWTQRACKVPDRELAAMNPDQRNKVINHIAVVRVA